MTEFPEALPPPSVPSRRGNPFMTALAWLVILATCAHVIWDANRPPDPEELAAEPLQLSLPGELTAKMCVGLGDWSPEAREMLLAQAEALDQEGLPGKAAKAVLAAELTGLEAARTELASARLAVNEERADQTRIAQERDASGVAPDEKTLALETAQEQKRQEFERVLDVLDRLYAGDAEETQTPRTPPALGADDRALLESQLTWVGRLAPLVQPLAEGSAERDALISPLRKVPFVAIGVLGWGGLCLLIGLAGLITLLVMGLSGRLRHGFGPASGRGGVYAEIFALWLAIFVGGNMVADYFQWGGLIITLALTTGGLVIALCWGLVRGIAWREMRADMGLHAGRGVFAEIAAGLMTYCMAIPMLVVALLLTLGLSALQKQLTPEAPPPSHPVQQFIASGDWVLILQAMLLASVIAPIVEETIFRGALYRHLRDATSKLGLIASFILSAGVSSLLFAAIHPQGWPFIPVLASLALTFCLAREWRGSLLPGMVAHGVNNFVIMTLNVLLLGS